MVEAEPARDRKDHGFSLVELMVVMGIIALVAAVSLPNIMQYVRSANVRAAQDGVVTALQTARSQAIMKNTQLGVSFVVQNDNTYYVHIEDTAAGTAGSVGFTRQAVDFANPDTVLTTRFVLPTGVVFGDNTGDCPVFGAVNPFTAASLRFDRYGVPVVPGTTVGSTTFPALVLAGGSATSDRIYNPGGADRFVCLVDRNTGMWRLVRIARTGRIAKN